MLYLRPCPLKIGEKSRIHLVKYAFKIMLSLLMQNHENKKRKHRLATQDVSLGMSQA